MSAWWQRKRSLREAVELAFANDWDEPVERVQIEDASHGNLVIRLENFERMPERNDPEVYRFLVGERSDGSIGVLELSETGATYVHRDAKCYLVRQLITAHRRRW